MPRKKKPAAEAAHTENDTTTATLESPRQPPAYIDGPPVDEEGKVVQVPPERAKNWGDPYKAIVKTPHFEMGENRRFKQRVFMFNEKPEEQILAALKDGGFTYRANEKAWTIHADADTRRLSDELARAFSGQAQGMSR